MNKRQVADRIAKAHKDWEPNLTSVFLVESSNEADPREPLKLLEVVVGTTERGIEPVAFPPDPAKGRDCFLYIIEVSPRELGDIRRGALTFERGDWRIGPELAA